MLRKRYIKVPGKTSLHMQLKDTIYLPLVRNRFYLHQALDTCSPSQNLGT